MSLRRDAKPKKSRAIAFFEGLQRKKNLRSLARRFLIVCEDTKSSVAYFEDLIGHLSLTAASVVVAGSEQRTQPIQVVDTAIALEKAAAKDVPFDQVWCVVDGDFGSKIQPARERAKANEISIAVTTMCFEYWIILHFEQAEKPKASCGEYESYLRAKHVPGYAKGKTRYGVIVPHARVASRRSRQLRERRAPIDINPEDHNPCSTVYLLVDELFEEVDRIAGPQSPKTPPQGLDAGC